MSNYKYSVLADSPIGCWTWQDPPSSTSPLKYGDCSGFQKDATVNVSGMDLNYLPFVTGLNQIDGTVATKGRSIGFFNNSHSVVYPNLEIWGQGQEQIPFTIEFWVHPVDTSENVWIFAPTSSGTIVTGNGVRMKNNTVYFEVTGTNGVSATAAAPLDEPEDSYHVVCVYHVDFLAIHVNGELVTTTTIPAGIAWSTAAPGYTTICSSITAPLVMVLGTVTAYKSPLSTAQIKSHYFQQSLAQSPVDIAGINDGNIFYLNNADRTHNIAAGPPVYMDWAGCELKNVTVDERNYAALRTIPPMKVNSGSVSFTGARASLTGSKYLITENVENHITGGSGSFGFYFNLSNANNNGVEQGIASLIDGDRRTTIDIVKKSDNSLYLRYKYRPDSTEIVQDVFILTPTYPSDNYAFVQFDSGKISVLINNGYAELDLSDGTYIAPQISTGSLFYLGAASSGTPFSGQVWHFNLWNVMNDINNVASVRNSIDWYTAKLFNDLNISQTGYVKFSLASGNDGLTYNEVMSVQNAVTWRPVTPSISVSVSTDDAAYTNIVWHADLPITNNPLPPVIYIKATLTTDNSALPTYLKQLFFDSFTNNAVFGENSLDELSGMTLGHIEPSTRPMILQSAHTGARVYDSGSAFYIDPENLLTDVTPDGSSGTVSGRFPLARTVEFWVRPEQQGYLFYWQGAPEHSLQINSAGQFVVRGFNQLYLDGQVMSAGNTETFAANASRPFQKWHHLILTKRDFISDIDDTPFTLASGSTGSLYLDKTFFYLGSASHALVQGSGATYASIVGTPGEILPSKTYTFSTLVWPETGTSVVTKVGINGTVTNQTHSVTAGKWNVISRTITIPATIDLFTIDLGRDTGTLGSRIWIDDPAIILSSAASMTFSDAASQTAWFGKPPLNGTQAVARFQYPTYYYGSFSDAMALENFNRYLGNAGVILDTGSGKTETFAQAILRDNLSTTDLNPRVLSTGWTVIKTTS